MGHHSRTVMAAELHLEVHADTNFIDDGTWGENRTGNQTWQQVYDIAVARGDEWGVVLQDDAVPVSNFRYHVEEALAFAPNTAVGLYVGTCRPRTTQVQEAVNNARTFDASWLEADTLLWGVGVALPVDDIPEYLAWSPGIELAYDQRIGSWFRRSKRPVRYVWPSLVDHADVESVVDSLGLRAPRQCQRVAHEWGINGNWDGPVVQIAPARSGA